MAEATALRERVEMAAPGEAEHVVAGFRDNGFSIYFGSDPVFHFDADGALRRAFVGGNLYRSQSHTLARLTRTRLASGEVRLIRHDLDPGELEQFLIEMRAHIDALSAALEQGTVRVVRQVPPEVDLAPRLAIALDAARQGKLSPAIKRRR